MCVSSNVHPCTAMREKICFDTREMSMQLLPCWRVTPVHRHACLHGNPCIAADRLHSEVE